MLTGTLSSGKSTMIRMLEARGFRVVHEAARVYIDEQIALGKTIEQIRADERIFQENILRMKIEIEHDLPKDELIFFDRGIPDTEAYYDMLEIKDSTLLEQALKDCHYKRVFFLDHYPLKKDYARTETEEEQVLLARLLRESYARMPFPLIDIKKFETKEARLEHILTLVG